MSFRNPTGEGHRAFDAVIERAPASMPVQSSTPNRSAQRVVCSGSTIDPIMEADNDVASNTRPEMIRLPAPGQRCPWTGLSRSGLNELILPTRANDGRPPVRSFVLRRRGAKTGVRLIDYGSLIHYIRRHPETAYGEGVTSTVTGSDEQATTSTQIDSAAV